MLYGFAAIVIVGIIIFIWVNVQMVRQSRAENGRSEERTTKPQVRNDASPKHSEETPSTEATAPRPDATHETAARAETGQAEDIHGTSPQATNGDVEVMEQLSRQAGPGKIFQKPSYPFFLNDTSVPEFDSEPWRVTFLRLMAEPSVVGWIAFDGEIAGASDHAYDNEFLEVLRSYRRSVERLRREVGLSAVSETSVVGEEGKIWFITAVNDIWMALFVEQTTDVKALADNLLAPLRD